jgi:hypothetical protein
VTADEIRAKLEELTEVRAAAEVTRLDYEAKRAEILKAIQAELDSLEAEYKPLLDRANERAAELETEVKQAVITHGASVKGGVYHVVFVHGRITWDNKELDQYAKAHPEILPFREEGSPTASLRTIK